MFYCKFRSRSAASDNRLLSALLGDSLVFFDGSIVSSTGRRLFGFINETLSVLPEQMNCFFTPPCTRGRSPNRNPTNENVYRVGM